MEPEFEDAVSHSNSYKYVNPLEIDPQEPGKCYITDNEQLHDPAILDLIGTKYKKVVIDTTGPIDNLPDGITHINITCETFNSPVDNLPASLKYLRIGGFKHIYQEGGFNQPLDYLPMGLKCLILEALEEYTHKLDNLPPTLETLLILNREYKLPLDNLPSSITRFYNFDYYAKDPDNYCDYPFDEITQLWNTI